MAVINYERTCNMQIKLSSTAYSGRRQRFSGMWILSITISMGENGANPDIMF